MKTLIKLIWQPVLLLLIISTLNIGIMVYVVAFDEPRTDTIFLISFGALVMNFVGNLCFRNMNWFKTHKELENLIIQNSKKLHASNRLLYKLREMLYNNALKEQVLERGIEGVIGKEYIEDVVEIVFSSIEEYSQVSKIDLKAKTRKINVAQMRQIFSRIIAKELNTVLTLENIGYYINRDHATVLHHCKQHSNLYETDRVYAAKYDTILKNVLTEIDVYFQE